MQDDIKAYLPLVRRPSRYIGGEVNSVRKDPAAVSLRFGLGFPDAYEVGMSHLGVQILYQILNSRDDIACERVFAPWVDMEALLRDKGIRLATLESSIPLSELDIMGFSLQYELSYTNVLCMLELGGIPISAGERGEEDPLVIGGGPSVFNPEPVADFFDAFLLGDGEEAVLEIADAVIQGKRYGEVRRALLKRLADIEGVYVPSFFDVTYKTDGTVKGITPLEQGYDSVRKRVVKDLESLPLPVRPVVPFTETIHDRVTVEIARGCTRGCRFCQAGMTYRPAREKNPGTVVRTIREALKNTGYDEASLLSLSTGDYTRIEELLCGLMRGFVEDRVAVSLPSLRVGTLNATLAGEIKKVRKTGFTLAPEAGSVRLRSMINKGITEEDLLRAASEVFSLGWKSMKLYFMAGLPTETEEDLLEIVRLAKCVRKVGKDSRGGRAPQVNVSVGSFIPKPFTPFQWEPQVGVEKCTETQKALRKALKAERLGFKWHDAEMSLLEGVLSRGDRRLSKVILRAFGKGARFDGWSEKFRFDHWEEAFCEEGLDTAFYTERRRPFDELFPWDHLDAGVKKGFLIKEYEAALALAETPDCKVSRCTDCGVCDHKLVKNVVASGEDALPDQPATGPEKVEEAAGVRLRVRYSKTGMARFLSHLELVDAAKRLIRRAGIPVKYSQGFHPLPRLSFSEPLPVGLESMDEYLDMELSTDGRGPGNGFTPREVLKRLNAVSPEGVKFLDAGVIPLKPSAVSDKISVAEYLIFLKNGPLGIGIEPKEIDGILRDFCRRESVLLHIVKKDKVREVDIRPLVREIELAGDGVVRLVLRRGESVSVKPQDVLANLFDLSKEEASLIPILKTKAV